MFASVTVHLDPLDSVEVDDELPAIRIKPASALDSNAGVTLHLGTSSEPPEDIVGHADELIEALLAIRDRALKAAARGG